MQNNRKIIYGMLFALLTLVLILSGIIFSKRKDVLQVAFLDVGQGDSILISEIPSAWCFLIKFFSQKGELETIPSVAKKES